MQTLDDEPVAGGLMPGAQLADSVTGLARAHHAFSYQVARRLHAAVAADALATTARSTLQALGWSGRDTAAVIDATRLLDSAPDLTGLWRDGVIGVDAVATIARGTTKLTEAQRAMSSSTCCLMWRCCRPRCCAAG